MDVAVEGPGDGYRDDVFNPPTVPSLSLFASPPIPFPATGWTDQRCCGDGGDLHAQIPSWRGDFEVWGSAYHCRDCSENVEEKKS